MSNELFLARLNPTGDPLARYAAWLLGVAAHQRVDTGQTTPTPLVRAGEWWLKREDASMVGSHKFRSLGHQLGVLRARQERAAVLSSSGNAAIAASRYAAAAQIHLLLLLSPATDPAKLAALTHSEYVTAVLSTRARRLAKYAATRHKLPDLRPSVDTQAAVGLRTLGFEIYEQLPTVANIFTFITSGASLLGLWQAFAELQKLGIVTKLPQLFGVYSVGELAGQHAGGGVDKLRIAVAPALAASGGELIAVDDAAILATRQKLAAQKLVTSAEGMASWAAAAQVQPVGETVVVFSGAARPPAVPNWQQFHRAETFAEIDTLIKTWRA